jgi:hypothetical protein
VASALCGSSGFVSLTPDQAVANIKQAATERCEQVLSNGRDSYEQLLVKYTALKRTHDTVKTNSSEKAGQREVDSYVMVLIDAHSHKVM